jgi:AcrR family transcriptional regulator
MIEPKSTDSRTTSPEDTRERILIAARDAIARKGKRSATTREIAEAAGVNEATLFRHFGNKEALILATVRYTCPDVEIRGAIAALQGPLEADLLAIARAMTEGLESRIDMIRWSLVEAEYENSVFSQDAWRPQDAVREAITEYMITRVASGELRGKPEELASILIGMLFMRVLARTKFPDSALFNDNEYALPYIINVFLNGVRSKD